MVFYLFSYEPWKAPIEVQERASCVIGRDYPNRLVDHVSAMEKNKSEMEVLLFYFFQCEL